ncbi:aldo/keto reductase [Curtobacterium flaccumfaciens pv. flaccumfaciens]
MTPNTTASSTPPGSSASGSCPSRRSVGASCPATSPGRTASPAGDARRNLPRFSDEAIDANLRIVDALKVIADEKGVTTAQLALAWLIQAGTVPIPGTTRASRVEENVAAADVVLTAGDLDRIEAAAPHGVVVGARNTEAGMARDRG